MLAEDFGVSSVLLLVKAGEALFAVRNVDTAIDGTLHGGKDFGTSGSASKTSIEEGLEGLGALLSIELLLIEAKDGHDTASNEETSAVGSSIVGQTNLNAKLGQLVSISRGKDKVTLDLGIDNLTADVSVGEADDETILGHVILVLVLNDQTLASIIISLTLAASAVFNLEALEVGLVLD